MSIKKDLIAGMFSTPKADTPAKKKTATKAKANTATDAPAEDTRLISLRVADSMHLAIKHLAEARGISASALILDAVAKELKASKKELDRIEQIIKSLGV